MYENNIWKGKHFLRRIPAGKVEGADRAMPPPIQQ
jgi:hypothetical protein